MSNNKISGLNGEEEIIKLVHNNILLLVISLTKIEIFK